MAKISGTKRGDTLIGTKGADKIFGGGGNDHIAGGKGSDLLSGGKGADTFHFKAGKTGSDVIDDFQNGVDKIDLNGFGFKGNFAALMSHAHQEGSNVIFKFDNGEQIKFLNTDIGMFDKGDFF